MIKKLVLLSAMIASSTMIADAERYTPAKLSNPPVIDGILNDQAWTECSPVREFITFIPDFDKELDNPTTAFMGFDSENLYFAFRCDDDEPGKIKSSVNARDNIRADDWVCINLDSFNDQQSLYAFYVNPRGIQMDSRFAAGNEDFSEDYIWFSAGKTDSTGYSVEIRIPLKSIRFSNKEPVEMSIFFERFVSRTSEHASWPRLDPAKGYAFLSQMSPLQMNGVTHFTLFELLPAFTYSYSDTRQEGILGRDVRDPKPSLTAKYGITSQLILDATVNPDFSQVEADAGQVDVNLRYQLYYPEKRQFFLEGNEIFNVASENVNEIDPVTSFLHTRTITDPLAGLKLTGKVGKNGTLGLLYAVDRNFDELGYRTGFSHFPVARYKQRLKGENYLGLLFTGREKSDRFNRNAGADGQIRLDEATMMGFNAFVSRTGITEETGTRTGSTAAIDILHDTRKLAWSFSAKEISKDYIADAGFITRNGLAYFTGTFKPKFYPDSSFIRRVEAEFFTSHTYDLVYDMWETLDHASLQAFMGRSSTFKIKYAYSTEVYMGERFKTGGLSVLLSSQVTKRLYLGTLYRRLNAIYYSSEPYQGYANRLTFNVEYKPTENLHMDLSLLYNDLTRSDDGARIYEYPITRGKLTYQINKYLFVRAITEYNAYRESLVTDFLASFTYVPGTVIYLGYGSLYERLKWDSDMYVSDDRFLEMKRGFFFKCSYLFRI
jgi:hypothetical protein